MIASTSAIKLLLLATVAFAKNHDQDAGSSSSSSISISSTLLRGKTKQVAPPSSSSSRALAEDINMINVSNIGLNQMECNERLPLDGSVICTFRTIPPADMTYGNIHHDCMYSQALDGNYCISTEVYRANFDDVPVPPGAVPPGGGGANTDPMPPPPTDPMPPVQGGGSPGMGGGTGTGTHGICPTAPQVTGMSCAQYVPIAATEFSCMYNNGNLQCNCALQDNIATNEGWNCRTIGGSDGSVVVPIPAPVQPPITVVDAEISSVVVNGPEVPPGNTGVILPYLSNLPDCPPTQPLDGVESCEKNRRCQYYVRDSDGNPYAAVNCDCNSDKFLQCRTALDPIFGQGPGGSVVVPPPAQVQPPITTVDAEISSVVVNVPEVPPNVPPNVPPVTTGQILPNLNNNPDCPPIKPPDGVVQCEKNRRCKYYDPPGNPTVALNCDCNGEGVFQCRLSQDPLFGQQQQQQPPSRAADIP